MAYYLRLGTIGRATIILVPIIGLWLSGICVYKLSDEIFISMTYIAMICGLTSLGVAFWLLGWILERPEGSTDMREISRAIREGAEGYYSTQNGYIFKISVVVSILLFVSYMMRDPSTYPHELRSITPFKYGLISSGSFFVGSISSALCGYAGVWVSVRSNNRVANAAHQGAYFDALKICFRGGAYSSIVNIALGIVCLSGLIIVAHILMPEVPVIKLPLVLVGFGFGASLVALFAQLGGGIFTKAADVGADLVGKIECGIPEDDYRNPAVIADLVGDNVGDCAGQCADIFESLSAEILATMILASTLASEAKMDPKQAAGFVLFPLAVHIMDLVISTIAIMCVGNDPHWRRLTWHQQRGQLLPTSADCGYGNPLREMVLIYLGSCTVGSLGFTGLCWLFLNNEAAPGAWINLSICGVSGIVCSLVFLYATQYYTDYNFKKVRRIAEASTTGPATNIITGLANGMESTAIPVLAISVSIVMSYHHGYTSGLCPDNPTLAGLFGTAVATMGMLCSAVYVLSMSSFGCIADNAGGIVEMTKCSGSNTRDITDKLDAVGNVTKANTKGFSVGTAALASFLLFSAFLDEVSVFVTKPFKIVDITSPDVFVGGLLGAATIFVFSSFALSAVGDTAMAVVEEVRRQFRERPNIMAGGELPDYRACVEIVSHAAVRQMIAPGLLACLTPICVGIIFR